MPRTKAMSLPAQLFDFSEDSTGKPVDINAPVKLLPAQLKEALDSLFTDAKRRGPFFKVFARKLIFPLVLLPASLWIVTLASFREYLLHAVGVTGSNLIIVLLFMNILVWLGAAIASVVRMRVAIVFPIAAANLALGYWLVTALGQIVWASIPTSIGALLLGSLAASMIKRVVWALPLLAAASLSDAQSFMFGITGKLVENNDTSPAVDALIQTQAVTKVSTNLIEHIDILVLHIPVLTGTWMLGIVDVLAIGMLLGLSYMLWVPVVRSALALALVVSLASASSQSLPVIPLLGIAWVFVNYKLVWQATRFSLRRLLYLGG